MEKKEENQKDNRFTYSSDEGLKVLSEKDILDSIGKESDKKDIQKSEADNIKGGKADNLTIQDIADKHKVSIEEIKKQFKQGIEVEMEHTDDPAKAAEICRDHLFEFSDYYTRLAKMEGEAKKEKE